MGEAATKEGRPRRGRRLAKRALLTLLGSAAVWLALILDPQPLFAYSAQRANVILYTRAPMPPQTGPLLDEVVRRISRSRSTTRAGLTMSFLRHAHALRVPHRHRLSRGRGRPRGARGQRLHPAVQHRARDGHRAQRSGEDGRTDAGLLHRARGDPRDDGRSNGSLALSTALRLPGRGVRRLRRLQPAARPRARTRGIDKGRARDEHPPVRALQALRAPGGLSYGAARLLRRQAPGWPARAATDRRTSC